jgi:uncharacterized protein (TIGR02646 family)
MIRIYRSAKAPIYAQSSVFKKMKEDLKKFYAIPQAQRRQQKPPYIPLPASVLAKIREYMFREFNGKCVYCESEITKIYQGDFDHFRPKSSARGLDEKEFKLDHYWTLAFNWRNMYLCCDQCNKYKVNWFPVVGPRAPLTNSYHEIVKKEKNLLLDPCRDSISKHFSYNLNGTMVPVTQEGKVTIDILTLNRKMLVEGRQNALKEALNIYNKIVQSKQFHSTSYGAGKDRSLDRFIEWSVKILEKKSPLPYIGMQLFFLKKWLTEDIEFRNLLFSYCTSSVKRQLSTALNLKPTISTTIKKSLLPTTASSKIKTIESRVNIHKIEVMNFKSIERLEVEFPKGGKSKDPWVMLLGENGVGKSSFLQAIALTLMGNTYMNKLGIKPKDILRHGEHVGYVKIHREGQNPIELHFTNNRLESSIQKPQSFLLGYGSTRLFATKKVKAEKTSGMVRAQNLFNPFCPLHAEDWLVNLSERDNKKFDFACRALKSLLIKELEDPKIRFIVRDTEIYLHYSDKKRKPDQLDELSDGFKSIIALACDMMEALMIKSNTMEVAEGIVLIDEIGTHLHPRWKMRVVNSFRRAFPRMQFIVTTHDPLCLKGLKEGEVIVLTRKNNRVEKIINLPDPGAYRADQLLSSRFFGLNSTIDADLENDFNNYYYLLSLAKHTKSQELQLSQLKEKLKDKNHLGDSLREELALTAADKILSEEKAGLVQKSLLELEQETVNVLRDLWNQPVEKQIEMSTYEKVEQK